MLSPSDKYQASLANAICGKYVEFNHNESEAALAFMEESGVTPLLDRQVRNDRVGGLTINSVKSLHNSAKTHAALELILNHDTVQAIAALAGARIPVMLLKGSAVAHLHYDAAYHRTRCDTDLYIRPSEKHAVAQLLGNMGLTVAGLSNRPNSSRQFSAYRNAHTGAQIQFDIHWKLSNRMLFADTLPFEECFDARQPVPALGPDAWALCDIDLLIHACIHRIAHGRGTERNRLIWLYDIHLLWTAMDEEEQAAFIEKALAKKIGAVCADALNVCEDLFGTLSEAPEPCRSGFSREQEETTASHSRLKPLPQTTPDTTLNALLKNQADEPTASLVNAGKFRWAWADLKATPGLRAKFHFARELLQNQL